MSHKHTLQINTPFYVDKWLVDPLSNRIKCKDKEIKLEPKVMAVLVCLAQSVMAHSPVQL